MREIILRDVKVIFHLKRFWISAGIIVACTIINLITSVAFDHSKPVGALGLFIYGNIFNNPMMYFMAPFIPAFIFGPLIMSDMKSGTHNDMLKGSGIKKYFAARSISSLVAGASIFIVSFLIILAGCFIFDHTAQPIDFEPTGLFQQVYYSSSLLYILLFILYSALFGAVFSFFSLGIGLATNRCSMAMTLPGIVYHGSIMAWYFFDNHALSWIRQVLPSYTYIFMLSETPVPWLDKAVKLGAILVVSLLLVAMGYLRLKNTMIKPVDESLDI